MKLVQETKDMSVEDKSSSESKTDENEPKDITEGEITNLLKDLTEELFSKMSKEAQEITQKIKRN